MEIFPRETLWGLQLESLGGMMGFGPAVHTTTGADNPSVIVVCEHATNRIPECLGDMGLSPKALESHIAWDPGALPVARGIAERMSAPLIYGGVSRLVYDCNRPPEASDAMPAQSEDYSIPANANLSAEDRATRVAQIYEPFSAELAKEIERHRETLDLMVTVHSFTPVYRGQNRTVEIGVLHGADDRFARAMLNMATPDLRYDIRLNEPYSAADGVAHTLDLHTEPGGLLNVMLEIRNDLIRTPEQQQAVTDDLVPWIERALAVFRKRAGT